jgi:hypothetical protein
MTDDNVIEFKQRSTGEVAAPLVENECCKCKTKLMRRKHSDSYICDDCFEILQTQSARRRRSTCGPLGFLMRPTTSRRERTVGKLGAKHVNKRRLKTPEELEQAFRRRFWAYVDRAGPNDCWLWNISVGGPGYGQVWRVDRMVMHVLHSCDVKACCNPAHLHLGTHTDNMREMHERGRQGVRVPAPSPNRKLTPEQVRFIRSHAGKLPKQRMAKQYGVAPFVVDTLIKGLSYKDVV